MKKIALTLLLVLLLIPFALVFADSRPEVSEIKNWEFAADMGTTIIKDFAGMPYSGRVVHGFALVNPSLVSDYSFCVVFLCVDTKELLVVALINIKEMKTTYFYIVNEKEMIEFLSKPYTGKDARFLNGNSASI